MVVMDEKATFLAAFPATQSAMRIHGSGDGMRIELDIPASEMAEAVKLQLWTQVVLRVTVEPEADGDERKGTKSYF